MIGSTVCRRTERCVDIIRTRASKLGSSDKWYVKQPFWSRQSQRLKAEQNQRVKLDAPTSIRNRFETPECPNGGNVGRTVQHDGVVRGSLRQKLSRTSRRSFHQLLAADSRMGRQTFGFEARVV